MLPTFRIRSRYAPNSRWAVALPVVVALALPVAFLRPEPASAAYVDIAGIGATGDPAEFSQYVSPNTQQNFSTWTPGPYASPQSLGSNGYSADVEAKSAGVVAGLKVISPGSLTTQDAGAELIYTVTSGNPTGMGGYMRLVDADGATAAGQAILTSFVMSANSGQTQPVGPITVAFDAITGFDLTAYGLPSSFFIGLFLLPSVYALDPTIYYSGVSLQPDPVESPTLFAAFDTAGFGASTLFVPEPSTASLFALSVLVLARAAGRSSRARATVRTKDQKHDKIAAEVAAGAPKA